MLVVGGGYYWNVMIDLHTEFQTFFFPLTFSIIQQKHFRVDGRTSALGKME